jgi:glutamyl-tRNA reductase
VLVALGASHHDLDLNQLDRLTLDSTLTTAALSRVVRRKDAPIVGAVVVATCNRLEIYLDAERFHDAIHAVADELARVTGIHPDEVAGLLEVRAGTSAVTHLFTVVAGLDSMVVGEAQISGQIARAFREAQSAGHASPLINQLFQHAARVAKQVARETELGAAGRSVASVALDIAGADDAAPSSALLIGTGAYARVVAAELRTRGLQHLSVHSPSGRADAFARRHSATPVGAEELIAAMTQADLIVACSGQSTDMFGKPTLEAAVARRNRPLLIIDLALHPHVAGAGRLVPGVRIIDLRSVQEAVGPTRLEAITDGERIVSSAVTEFEERMAIRGIDPAVTALRQHVSSTFDKELVRFRAKYPSDITRDLEHALHRVSQALLHTPTLRAKEFARSGDVTTYGQALHTLFGIDFLESEHAAHEQVPTLRTG